MRAILRVVAEAQVWGGYSMSVLRRVVSYLAAKTVEPATAAFGVYSRLFCVVCVVPLMRMVCFVTVRVDRGACRFRWFGR